MENDGKTMKTNIVTLVAMHHNVQVKISENERI